MPIAVGDTIRTSFLGTCFGQRIIFDLSYECTVANPALSTAAGLNELNAQVTAGGANDILINYLAVLPPQYTLNQVRSQIIRPVRSAYFGINFVGTVGTNANAATMAADSAAITRRTDTSGRNQVSTLKVGPCPDAAAAAGLLTGAYQLLLSNLGTDTIKTLLMPVSTNQFVATILGPTGLSLSRRLVQFLVQPQARTHSRRVVGRGE